MNLKLNKAWISLEKVESFAQSEPGLLTIGLSIMAWIIFKVFQKHLPERREKDLQLLFKNLTLHILIGILFFILYSFIFKCFSLSVPIIRTKTYLGLAYIVIGAICFIKAWRIILLGYFLLSTRMKGNFPVLLMNLFTLLISIVLGSWLMSEIFNIQLTSLLATSAIFSLVLGLALQDTLGNLFSGVALQVDKPYQIGDWIEIQTLGQKWIGQVSDISWRATVLNGTAEEAVTIPNRIVGQAQISNFSIKSKPIVRAQIFKLPFGVSLEEVKKILLDSILSISEIKKKPAPMALISETNESSISFKLVYLIDNYGDQNSIGDRVLTSCLTNLEKNGFQLSGHHLRLSNLSKD